MRVQKAIFPGFAFGVMFLVFVTNWIANPNFQPQVAAPVAAGIIPVGLVLPAQEQKPQDAQPTPETAAQETAPEPVAQAEPEQPAETSCSISPRYPDTIQQWCAYIDRYSAEHGVSPNLIAAVMLQESGGNPDAYSKSGAVGLMQVMPRDGLAASFQCVNGPCFASRPSMAELYDPEFNIAYGTRMLSGLIAKKGSEREALKSYGPMNMGYRYADIVLNIVSKYSQ